MTRDLKNTVRLQLKATESARKALELELKRMQAKGLTNVQAVGGESSAVSDAKKSLIESIYDEQNRPPEMAVHYRARLEAERRKKEALAANNGDNLFVNPTIAALNASGEKLDNAAERDRKQIEYLKELVTSPEAPVDSEDTTHASNEAGLTELLNATIGHEENLQTIRNELEKEPKLAVIKKQAAEATDKKKAEEKDLTLVYGDKTQEQDEFDTALKDLKLDRTEALRETTEEELKSGKKQKTTFNAEAVEKKVKELEVQRLAQVLGAEKYTDLSTKQARVREMAKNIGLDPNDPNDRKQLREFYQGLFYSNYNSLQEQREAARDAAAQENKNIYFRPGAKRLGVLAASEKIVGLVNSREEFEELLQGTEELETLEAVDPDVQKIRGAAQKVNSMAAVVITQVAENSDINQNLFGERSLRALSSKQKQAELSAVAKQISESQPFLQPFLVRQYTKSLSPSERTELLNQLQKLNRAATPAGLIRSGLEKTIEKLDEGLGILGEKTGVTPAIRKARNYLTEAELDYKDKSRRSKSTRLKINIGRVSANYKKLNKDKKGVGSKLLSLGGALIGNVLQAAGDGLMQIKVVANGVSGINNSIATIKEFGQAVNTSAPVRFASGAIKAVGTGVQAVGTGLGAVGRGALPGLGLAALGIASGGGLPAALALGGAGLATGAVTRTLENMLEMSPKVFANSIFGKLSGGLGIGLKEFITNNNFTNALLKTEGGLARITQSGLFTRNSMILRGFNRALVAAPIAGAVGALLGGPVGLLAGLGAGVGASVGLSVAGDAISNVAMRRGLDFFKVLNLIPFDSISNVISGNRILASQTRVFMDRMGAKDISGRRLELGSLEKQMYGFNDPFSTAFNSAQLGLHLYSTNLLSSQMFKGGFAAVGEVGTRFFNSRIGSAFSLGGRLTQLSSLVKTLGLGNVALGAASPGVMRGIIRGAGIGSIAGSVAGVILASYLGLTPGIAAAILGAVGGVVGGFVGAAVAAPSGFFAAPVTATIGGFLGSAFGTGVGAWLDTNIFNRLFGLGVGLVNPLTFLLGIKEFMNFLTTPIRNFKDYATVAMMAFSVISFIVAVEKATNGSLFSEEAQVQGNSTSQNVGFKLSAASTEFNSGKDRLIINKTKSADYEFNGIESLEVLADNSVSFKIAGKYWVLENPGQYIYSPSSNSLVGTGQNISAVIYKSFEPLTVGSADSTTNSTGNSGRVAGVGLEQVNFCEVFTSNCTTN